MVYLARIKGLVGRSFHETRKKRSLQTLFLGFQLIYKARNKRAYEEEEESFVVTIKI